MSFNPEWFSSLTPRVLFVTGAGFQRELIKDFFIAQVGAIAGKWILSPEQLALEILRDSGPAPQLISPAGRQEFYRLLFSNRRILAGYPRLRSLKRQNGFFRRLDQAVMACREVVAHEDERDVLEERLQSLELGSPDQREEIVSLAHVLDQWMDSQGVADAPRLLNRATQALVRARESDRLHHILRGRETLFRFSIQEPQALESMFLDELARVIACRDALELFPESQRSVTWFWKRSHTVQDSAERLVSELLTRDWSRQVILIPDAAVEVRLALKRALKDAGIPEFDPRDPQEIRISESFKQVFLVLECIASRWESSRVMALLASEASLRVPREVLALVQRKLSELGQRPGLDSVLRAVRELLSTDVITQLRAWEQAFQRRMNFQEFSAAHRSLCERAIADPRIHAWLERFWKDFSDDLSRLELLNTRYPLLIWMERIRGRVELAPPPISAVKPADGVRILRMSQANAVQDGVNLWILGLPASWLSPHTEADFYLGARERDHLSLEFSVRSGHGIKDSRIRALRSWIARAETITILDQGYHLDGSESEELESVLRELGAPEGLNCENLGADPRFLESYGLVRTAAAPFIELPPVPSEGSIKISATALDAMSRCSFLGLPQARWKLLEREEADWELWPRVRGVLMHQAVEALVRELEAETVSPLAEGSSTAMVERIWRKTWEEALSRGDVPGWIRSPQLELQIERNALLVLSKFLEKELEYRSRSGIRCIAAEEEARLSLSWHDSLKRSIVVNGKADRIDEHPEGLFVLDYKTGVQAFKGGDIRDRGYRLQLPFYAVAARERFKRPVLGVQLVELTREARRSVGLFPKRLNGKDAGMLTQLGKTNSGLYEGDPDDLWSGLEARIHDVVRQFADGRFEAKPVLGTSECQSCRARGICGQSRREWVQDNDSEALEQGASE